MVVVNYYTENVIMRVLPRGCHLIVVLGFVSIE
jgi:hypothetical protein